MEPMDPDRLLRLLADADNARKRALQAVKDAVEYGAASLAKDILGTVDDLERAISTMSDGAERVGVEMTLKRLHATLASHHVTLLDPLGEAFSPVCHEAISQRTVAGVAPGTVVEVLHKGALLRDRLLRPALVVVSAQEDTSNE